MQRFYDISVPLSATTPTYPGDPGIEITSWKSFAAGDHANVSLIHFGAHSGTHVDAPVHFLEGTPGVESLPLDVLIGEAQVVEVPAAMQVIEESLVLDHIQPGTTRVLFKSRNSNFWNDHSVGFRSDYTHIDPDAARALVSSGVKLVGIDYLSVEEFHSEKFETHQVLLSKGVVIVEGLDLRAVSPGVYELICLPLRLAGGAGDGAPARAVLRTLG